MRYFIFILILVVAVYLAYHQFLTTPSAEVKEIKQLEKEYNAAVRDFMRAVRTAGEIGMATIPDAQDALKRSKRLMVKIAEFYKKNDLY